MRAAILGISNRRRHGKSQFASDTRPARSVAFREARVSLNFVSTFPGGLEILGQSSGAILVNSRLAVM